MSGMRAGLFYPSWPDMKNEYFPQIIFNIKNWTVYNFKNYDSDLFAPALVQFLHRGTAYALLILALIFFIKSRKTILKGIHKNAIWLFSVLLISQVILGIITLINCVGSIPVGLGVAHQGLGILLFGSSLFLYFLSSGKSKEKFQ